MHVILTVQFTSATHGGGKRPPAAIHQGANVQGDMSVFPACTSSKRVVTGGL